MEEYPKTDEYWRKHLTQEAYGALRLGKQEEKGLGEYVNTVATGRYECAGCGNLLFTSMDKVDDGSGYATFQLPEGSSKIELLCKYSPEGEACNTVVCTRCGGIIGQPDNMSMRTADDLDQGGGERRLMHANSASLHFVKDATPHNYPIAYLVVLLALIVGGVFAWTWGSSLTRTAQHEGADTTIELWLGDSELEAKVVRLDDLDNENPSQVFGQDVMFIILSTRRNAPELRLPGQRLDIVWLDNLRRVISSERNVVLTGEGRLEQPGGAAYLIISHGGELPTSVFVEGYEVYVVDSSSLL